jgi:hypothetical protein
MLKHPVLKDKTPVCHDVMDHPSKKTALEHAIPIYKHKGPQHNGKVTKITSRKHGM